MHGHPCCYDRINYLGDPHPQCQCHPGRPRDITATPADTYYRTDDGGTNTNSHGDPAPQPVPISYGDQSPLF
jgi:hypothetical protein